MCSGGTHSDFVTGYRTTDVQIESRLRAAAMLRRFPLPDSPVIWRHK
jgi:hypothetical protein